ncbi:MAG: hypothetical protein AB1894_10675 [Chloroflexota bacterium]
MASTTPDQTVYQIELQGRLEPDWCDWFDGMSISHTASGNTLLSGRVADQAALHGLLAKVRDLGMKLVAVGITTNDISQEF